MALAAILDNLEGVDEALKPLYVEADGKFHLDLDDTIRDHPGVQPLANAYAAEKAASAKAKEAKRKAEADLAEALKGQPDAEALVNLRKELEAERDEWRGKAETAETALTGATRDRALADALTAAHVTNPAFVRAATAMLGSAVKMVDGKAIVETDMGPVEVAQHVKRWAAGEGKDFVTPAAGGGAKGQDSNTGGSPRGDMGGDKAARVAALKERMAAEG